MYSLWTEFSFHLQYTYLFFPAFLWRNLNRKITDVLLCCLQQIYYLDHRHFRSSYGQEFVETYPLKKKNNINTLPTHPRERLGDFLLFFWHKMALTLSRASLYCTFLGIVIFCIFTISSYVQIHLLCKYYFLLYYLICRTN